MRKSAFGVRSDTYRLMVIYIEACNLDCTIYVANHRTADLRLCFRICIKQVSHDMADMMMPLPTVIKFDSGSIGSLIFRYPQYSVLIIQNFKQNGLRVKSIGCSWKDKSADSDQANTLEGSRYSLFALLEKYYHHQQSRK